jgi:hypothetical protein
MEQDTRTQLAKARKLIQEKRYEDAEALLITIDDPKADEWLERLSRVSKTKTLPPEVVGVRQKDYTTKLIIMIVLYLFFAVPGIIAGALWAGQAKRDLELAGGFEIPNARNVIRLNRILFWLIIIAIVLALVFTVISVMTMSARLQ